MDRRTFLTLVGAGVLTGCTSQSSGSDGGDETPTQSPTPDTPSSDDTSQSVGSIDSPTPTPTSEPSPTPTPTRTQTPTATPTATPEPTPTPTPTPEPVDGIEIISPTGSVTAGESVTVRIDSNLEEGTEVRIQIQSQSSSSPFLNTKRPAVGQSGAATANFEPIPEGTKGSELEVSASGNDGSGLVKDSVTVDIT